MSALLSEAVDLAEPEIVRLMGRIDSMTSPEIEEDVLLSIRSGARDMILDCEEVTYITGTGVQTLLRLARRMQEARGKLVVCNLHQREIFDYCGLDSVIPVYESIDEARVSLAA